ncbi:MAG: AAA family ATPase [Minisyncoccota bacterium]
MIIGITGTNGAGKGTIVSYLETKGFVHYSVRALIDEEISRRGLTVNRDTMRVVANDLRKTHHPAYLIEELFKRAEATGGDAVVESVRVLGEAQYLKDHGAFLIAVDAIRRLRYERMVRRGSETDHISYDTFCEQEDLEMNNSEPWNLNIFGVMQMADYTIMNISTPDDLPPRIDGIVDTLRREESSR